MATSKKSNSTRAAVEIGAGIAAASAAAAAAGYYFYASKDAKKNRKVAAKWATNLKKDVIKEAKKVGDASPAVFAKVVDKAAAAYHTMGTIDKKDVKRAADELKRNWDMVKKEAKITKKSVVAQAKKVAKQVTTKAVKKSAKTVTKKVAKAAKKR